MARLPNRFPRRPPSAVVALVACASLGCDGTAGAGLERLGELAVEAAPDPMVTPAATPAAPLRPPLTTRAGRNALRVAGDINVEDRDPEVALLRDGEAVRVEIRHRLAGSARPDSTLVLTDLPERPGSYRLGSPGAPPGGRTVGAYFTSRSERVGSMKDFHHRVEGTLTLVEESPGVLAGTFTLAAEEPPPPPPPPPEPGAPPPSMLGKVPTPPPARVVASGTFLAVLATARPAPALYDPLPPETQAPAPAAPAGLPS